MPARRAVRRVSAVWGAPVSSIARLRLPLMRTSMRISVSPRLFSRSRGHHDHRRRAGPVGEIGVVAIAFREAQPHHAVRQVVFGVACGQDVAAQHAHDARAEFVAADDELDVLQLSAEQPHFLDPGLLGLQPPRVPLDAQAERQAAQGQVQLGRGRRIQHAVEGAAVDQHRHLDAIEGQGRDRTPIDDADRDRHVFEPAFGPGRGCGEQSRGHRDGRQQPSRRAPGSARDRGIVGHPQTFQAWRDGRADGQSLSPNRPPRTEPMTPPVTAPAMPPLAPPMPAPTAPMPSPACLSR